MLHFGALVNALLLWKGRGEPFTSDISKVMEFPISGHLEDVGPSSTDFKFQLLYML